VKRVIKMVAIIMAVVIVLVVSIGAIAMAAGPNPDPGTCPNTNSGNSGICPNPECPHVCPNPDCPCDGEQLQYQHQNSTLAQAGNMYRYQYRQVE
jgi:hypothetical protein